MTALPHYQYDTRRSTADEAVARLPESAFGNTEWTTMTARTGAEHLGAAIESGQPYRVANAIRSMAHAPSLASVDLLANAICDTIMTAGYARRNTETIAKVTNARQVASAVIAELRGQSAPLAPALSILRETVDGYVLLIGMRDPRMAERLNAVGAFAARLARSMKLSDATVLEVDLAGRLHDIAMMDVPRDRAERHAVAGATFLAAIPSLAHLAPLVRSHHERYDGLGYPDGLRGEEIPLGSRIISVAATFVDLVTEGPQGEAMLPHDACRELALDAGTKFDPEIVTATLHLLRYRQRTHRSA
jgi:HD-GYP domain-containing protein (c-di-GMP phosphodiesterase class II)